MINNRLQQKHYSILITLIVAFCLLFIGMRVPDLARPQHPKPSQRAVIESQVKVSQDIVNKSLDFFAILIKSAEFLTVLPYRTKFVFAFHSTKFPPLFPNSSRAPPLFLS
jgi:hypothetical protein